MVKFNEENERVKRRYLDYLKQADGHDEATLDKVAAALRDFEEALGFAPFKRFHRDWAARFKKHLDKRRNARTGQPLGLTTKDATLRLVKGFFHWLASQPGYRSRITFADARYFNNNSKDARAAHASRPERFPSLEQCAHAFRTMPSASEVERRDRAIFACLMLTGGRDGALASLRLKHVDLVEGEIFFDGREVRTKNGKTFTTTFFPVDPVYREAFETWVTYLREERLYGHADALFPKVEVDLASGRFAAHGLSREPYAGGQAIAKVVKAAFRNAGLPEYSPNTFRKTLAMLATPCATTSSNSRPGPRTSATNTSQPPSPPTCPSRPRGSGNSFACSRVQHGHARSNAMTVSGSKPTLRLPRNQPLLRLRCCRLS